MDTTVPTPPAVGLTAIQHPEVGVEAEAGRAAVRRSAVRPTAPRRPALAGPVAGQGLMAVMGDDSTRSAVTWPNRRQPGGGVDLLVDPPGSLRPPLPPGGRPRRALHRQHRPSPSTTGTHELQLRWELWQGGGTVT